MATSSTDDPWFADSIKLDLFGERCEYKNSGGTTGKLFCGGRTPIDCFDSVRNDVGDHGRYDCEREVRRQPMFTCGPF